MAMAKAMAVRKGIERVGMVTCGEWSGGGGGARYMASAVYVKDDASSSSASRRALAMFSALVGAGALYSSCQRMINTEPTIADATAFKDQECKPRTTLNPNKFVNFKLAEVCDDNHNTKAYKFAFNPQEALGLHVASCLVTKTEMGKKKDGNSNFIICSYTPISPPDSKGYFDLMIKIYLQGNMTQHLAHLKPGDTLEVKLPFPKIAYKPNMKKQIGMVARGTGLTPILQVIDAIVSNFEDNTQVSLIYANMTPADILLKSKLDAFLVTHPNFKVFYVISKELQRWRSGKGHINKDVLIKGLPSPSSDILILVCGPPRLMNLISGDKAPDKSQGELISMLKELGYTPEQVFKF